MAQEPPPINVVTDGCVTGIAGVVSQGSDWKKARVAAFFSAKLNSAQQNYPVHEIEMLAGVETMMRHKDILQGARFRWFTDHKGLVSLLQQKDLSGRQARWLEKLSQFDFEIVYVPGSENVLSDALSRIYSNDQPGTVRARSEYTYHDVIDNDHMPIHSVTMPLHVGSEGASTIMAVTRGQAKRKAEGANERQDNQTSVPPKERMEGGNGISTPKPAQKPEQQKNTSVSKPTETREKLTIRIPARPRVDVANNVQDAVSTQTPLRACSSGDALASKSIQSESSAIHTSPDTPSLVNLIHSAPAGIDVLSAIQNQYCEDPLFKPIAISPKEYKNFRLDNGLLLINIQGSERLCIPDVKINNRNVREILISEAHSLLAHLGARRTSDYLRDQVWWKTLVSDIASYCDSCITCRRSKPPNHKLFGLLQPLPVPSTPWENIGIDFVGPMPESKDRDATYDSITVIIDRLTGMIHLVPSRLNYNARQVAELIFREVYRLHGLPKSIISDRDTLFTSTFWQHLNKLIGIKLHMSSAYHPESDGSTERANRTVVQMLRQCIAPDQKNWVTKLPAIEFAINSACSEVTGYTPFFLNYGRMPRPLIWNSPAQNEYPGVRIFAQNLKNAVIQAHDSILSHRIKETQTANRKRTPSPFHVGDLVYISTKNVSFPRGLARKLVPKFIGPYPIICDFGNNSYKIGLSRNLRQRGVHDVFHSSLLRIHVPNDDRLFPGRLDTQVWDFGDSDQEWAVDRIRSHSGMKRSALFEILWKSGDVTWLPYEKIDHLTALEHYFEALGIDGIDQLEDNRAQRGPPPDEQITFSAIWIDTNLLDDTQKDAFVLTQLSLGPDSQSLPDLFPQHTYPKLLLFASLVLAVMGYNFRPPKWKLPLGFREGMALFSFIHYTDPAIWTILDLLTGGIIPFSAALLRLYIILDGKIRNLQPSQTLTHPVPVGYDDFVAIFNQHDTEFRLCYRESKDSAWIIPEGSRHIGKKIVDLEPFSHAAPPRSQQVLRNSRDDQ
ncbi:hypothetical protein NP233_g11530 [Leucocoprinus birnbaumii]|uniref:Integrase catalytic domain-containing protein n=1 Tax=Leucocoprinus birnbaumii TaxID=56174 RepID=A0AAD5YL76_9AGAR|nr:hypothetical protein NP233_g11530 [Leucocoprinus birnbaumii]